VETEKPSAFATVNCKLYESAIALYELYFREIVTQVQINPIFRAKTRHYSHEYHHTRDNFAVQYKDWRIIIGELGLHSKVIEEEVTRRLTNDLKW
jgi:hypothetical protein